MPTHAPPVADERAALAAYLTQQQDAFRSSVFGLVDAQAGLRTVPSELTLGGLLKHVTGGQRSWLEVARAAPERRTQERRTEDLMAEHLAQFGWSAEDTLSDALAAFDEVCAEVLDAVRTLDLDTPVPVPEAPWNPKDVESWSVRWVWFHLIEELARHAGHADIIREALDGATMIRLVAGREGWPESGWIKPWPAARETA